MEKQDRFIGIGEVARIFGVSTTTVKNWEARQRLPEGQRLPSGHRIWRASEVEKVARSQAGETNQAVSVAA